MKERTHDFVIHVLFTQPSHSSQFVHLFLLLLIHWHQLHWKKKTKQTRMIRPDIRNTMQSLHILYTLGHKVGLFLWFPKISCSKILLSLQPKLRVVFAGCIKENNILPCKCSDLLTMSTGILKRDCFGQIFKELQDKFWENPVFLKCAFIDLHLWLPCVIKIEWSSHT